MEEKTSTSVYMTAKNNPEMTIDITDGKMTIFRVSPGTFSELKKICNHYIKHEESEWCVCCGITFFKKK